MNSAIELVDEFIENLVRGDIESYILTYAWEPKAIQPLIPTLTEELRRLNEQINVYRELQDTEKRAEAAENVLNTVIVCRLNALLKNNPNSIKTVVEQRDFYKDRFEASQKRVDDLEDKLRSAYTAIDNMMQRYETMGVKGVQGEKPR